MIINDENFNEISKYCGTLKKSKELSRDEERELGERIQRGDEKAVETLVTANLKYVVRVAKRFAWTNIPIYDLISEGNIGLIKAAKKFNPSVGTKFITYADRWIRQSISEYIKKYNIDKEVCGIDEYVFEEECGDEFTDMQFEEEVHKCQSREDAINELMGCLDQREYSILSTYFGLNNTQQLTLDEIGEKMGLTQERVRQIKDAGIEKLQYKAMSNNSYAEFKELY